MARFLFFMVVELVVIFCILFLWSVRLTGEGRPLFPALIPKAVLFRGVLGGPSVVLGAICDMTTAALSLLWTTAAVLRLSNFVIFFVTARGAVREVTLGRLVTLPADTLDLFFRIFMASFSAARNLFFSEHWRQHFDTHSPKRGYPALRLIHHQTLTQPSWALPLLPSAPQRIWVLLAQRPLRHAHP